ncbi:MAG: PASTA domain-containing protein [Acidobacteriota bacterium]
MSHIAPGTVVHDRYEIERLIGSGGMADVWLANDMHLPRRVALKILHKRFDSDPEFIERFRREAEAAAALQHIHIVSIFDRGQVEDTYYIAMAYLDGRTLRELINAGLTPSESVAIIRQVLEAAGFAHHNGVVHRDFKPSNVIVDAAGLATVTDFGIARAGVSEITQTGSVMGTAHYLSPEQAQGLEVGPVSDLYSIGVMLYECLAGRVPFEGDSAVAVALKQMQEDPLPPSAWNPSVSPALDAVVLKALSRDPMDRYPDAASFIDALDAAEREPDVVPPPEPKSKKWLWAAVALGVILALLVVYGLTRDNTVEVPRVVGSKLDNAISRLSADGFSVGAVEEVQRDVPKDQVISQDPVGETGKDCKFLGFFCSNPDVDLTVSGGPGQVAVPDVTGQTRTAAETALDEAGFGVTVETTPSNDVDADLVISTDPPAGNRIRKGSTVTLVVSSGPKKVSVPPVVGLTIGAARQQISALGLSSNSTEQSSDRPSGEVISQSPDAGSKVQAGTVVEMVVSTGPKEATKVTVPSVVGSTQAEAETAIRNAGLSPSAEEQSTTIQPQDGRVINQNPTGGNKVERGSEVVIMIGVFDSGGAVP